MPEKEREHQKRANIPSNRIFGLKLEKGKEEGNGKKYHCKRKKTMAGRRVRYQRLCRRSSSTYSYSQLFSEETNKANYFYLMMLMARIVIGVV